MINCLRQRNHTLLIRSISNKINSRKHPNTTLISTRFPRPCRRSSHRRRDVTMKVFATTWWTTSCLAFKWKIGWIKWITERWSLSRKLSAQAALNAASSTWETQEWTKRIKSTCWRARIWSSCTREWLKSVRSMTVARLFRTRIRRGGRPMPS